ncbi:MAG: efflux transporter outer membrane subunit [Comamonadaceae bacterium]|nr:MAG: efflux transporter outer membrane subunit [Comamonadaceae bacterium]
MSVAWRTAAIALACVAVCGCAVGPDYQKPPVDVPVTWQVDPPWREAVPADTLDKGRWWQRFGDARLDALQQQALANSPTLAQAGARLAQARATVDANSAARLPQLALGTRASRLRISANRPLTNYNASNFTTVQNDFALSLTASYELDLAGRVQRSVEGATASAEQSAADLENTRLLLAADLATNYFNLRSTDNELDVLSRSIALQRRALDLVTARHDLGAVSGLDVAQQQALLETTLTQVDVLKKQRAQYEHAVATLTGTPAPVFALAPDLAPIVAPAIPLGVPSETLQRRPDVASAERAVAAANAQIGVATAAFYPSITLAPTVGVDSRMIESLFDAPSLLWSIGLAATQPLFDGGRLRANLDFAKAGYEGTVANYRRVVLVAMQEAEDGITGLAALDRATTQAQAAVAAARRVLDMSTARYEGGASTYLDVITAQQSLLTTERQAAQLQGQRLVTSVFLVKALGGDWNSSARAATF